MRRILYMAVAALMPMLLHAQGNIEKVLDAIEHNNTTLKALRDEGAAQKLENKTGLYLDDPEIGFDYLWGSPNVIGKRTDVSVRQSFDIATLSGLKGKVARNKNEMIDWQYRVDRTNLLLEAKLYCIDLIYYNVLMKELGIRRDNAKVLEQAQKKMLDSGEGSILEYNKVKLSLLSVEGEMSAAVAERNAIEAQLTRLNGGHSVNLDIVEYEVVEIPADFETWYAEVEAKNPVLEYVRSGIEVGKSQVALSKSYRLPSFSAGYMSEKTLDEHFQGISVGISVPLWSNKGRVRQAKAALQSAESKQADARQQFYSNLEIMYKKTLELKAAAELYKINDEGLKMNKAYEVDDSFLKKALEAGEISVLDYIVEMNMYYDIMRQALDAERDYQKACAELYAVEL